MKYPDETVFDEGPYCHCSGCHGDWKVDDWMSMSWPHYERGKPIAKHTKVFSILPDFSYFFSFCTFKMLMP